MCLSAPGIVFPFPVFSLFFVFSFIDLSFFFFVWVAFFECLLIFLISQVNEWRLKCLNRYPRGHFLPLFGFSGRWSINGLTNLMLSLRGLFSWINFSRGILFLAQGACRLSQNLCFYINNWTCAVLYSLVWC